MTLAFSTVNHVYTPSTVAFAVLTDVPNTLYERMENLILHIADNLWRKYYLYPKINRILKEQAHLNIPPVEQLSKRSKLALINYDSIIDEPAQLLPNVIGVGGLQIQLPAKPLPQVICCSYDNTVCRSQFCKNR